MGFEMNVTVFGGSKPKKDSPAYAEAYELGKLLAGAGHVVLTGGYIGTMEAASLGANEAGGHVIGVTCSDIENWRTIKPNQWIKEERRHKTLQERLNGLIEGCDAAIALPGGPGTLTEIALMWNLMIVQALPAKPLILIGAGWQAVFGEMYSSLGDYTPPTQRQHLHFVPEVQSAVAALNNHQHSVEFIPR
jgi:uncharacterized protein (TIGR00725 family)